MISTAFAAIIFRQRELWTVKHRGQICQKQKVNMFPVPDFKEQSKDRVMNSCKLWDRVG